LVNQITQKIIIYNRGSATLTSVTGNYTINGGSAIPFSWSGSLTTNKFSSINITINAVANGTVAVTIDKANNVTDQRASNNTATGTYTLSSAPDNHAFSSYTFRLQRDYFGSETTWNIKNSAGTTLYSGGPYPNTFVDKPAISPIPDLITQNWTLPNNQCYTFTINDSRDDGICCGTAPGESGTGYYDIKSADGSVIVTSGASFTTSQKISFTTNTLGNEEFEEFEGIYIYPNPTKGTLTINAPSVFGLPDSYTIFNNVGQIIMKNGIVTEADLTINTASLSNGIYFISIYKGNEKKTFKFIKN
jgi:hypothetical protein